MKWQQRIGALIATLTLTIHFAGAANFTACADALYALDLFAGKSVENGVPNYDLDAPCTRAEAAVMLVRLLGKEEEALAGTYETPFTDLQEWQKPFVGWLYENALTSGTSDTTFMPEGRCTTQMFSSFVLRALGWSEQNGDFSYANAITFAQTQSVFDSELLSIGGFTRDDAVAMSYLALLQNRKQEDASLLETLVQNGAVTAQAYADFQQARTVQEQSLQTLSRIITRGYDGTVELYARTKNVMLGLQGTVSQKLSEFMFDGTISISQTDGHAQTLPLQLMYTNDRWYIKCSPTEMSLSTMRTLLRETGMLEALLGQSLENPLVQLGVHATSSEVSADNAGVSFVATIDSHQLLSTMMLEQVTNTRELVYTVSMTAHAVSSGTRPLTLFPMNGFTTL